MNLSRVVVPSAAGRIEAASTSAEIPLLLEVKARKPLTLKTIYYIIV